MRTRLSLVLALLLAGCAHYQTPGGPVNLGDINRADIAEVASRQPSPHFPANLAFVRVQAPDYKSYSADAAIGGAFSVVTVNELLGDTQLAEIAAWPSVEQASPLNRLLLPSKLESIDDLRLAAAKLQADILVTYTIDTSFRIQGRAYGPLTVLSLGLVPDRDAFVTSTASAIFTDVRTGFTYGTAEATAKASGLTSVWTSADTIDAKRLEAEHAAFGQLVAEAGKTWTGIAGRYR